MRARGWLVCGGVVLCVLLGPSFFLCLADADVGVTVRVDAPEKVPSGSDAVIKIGVTEVTNFDVCQFDVSHDPRVLQITDVTAGDIDGTTVPIDMWGEVAPGKVRVLGNVPGIPGVDGAGYLAEIHFHVIGSSGDASDIGLSNGLLGDKYAEAIAPVVWEGDFVEVTASRSAAAPPKTRTECTETPMPSPEPSGALSCPEPTAAEGMASADGGNMAPVTSASAREGESEDEKSATLTYGLVFPMMVVLAAAIWIYGRRRSDQRGRRDDER